VEDVLFEGVDPVLIVFGHDGGVSFAVGDGLKEPISDAPKQHRVELRLCLEGGLDGTRGEGNQTQRWYVAWRELKWGLIW
jgi:hypothetical protein